MFNRFMDNIFGPGGPQPGAGGGNRPFNVQLQCFPVSFINKEALEKGNKIILPASALEQLARLNITWPMLFEVSNGNTSRMTHCGVMEFIAEEGTCYMPYWMMQNLLLNEGDLVTIKNTSLPKGRYVKLQPVTKDFLDISNPRAVLENCLRNYATLTVGDSIIIVHGTKRFEIEIVETRPAKAISIIETDVEVDFAPPKDYVEPTPVPKAQPAPAAPAAPAAPTTVQQEGFLGGGQRLDGKPIKKTTAGGLGAPPTGPPSTTVSNPNIIKNTGTFGGAEDDEKDEEPWKKRLPEGVRTSDPDFETLVKEGRVPGFLGKIQKGTMGKNNTDTHTPGGGNTDVFGGKGQTLSK